MATGTVARRAHNFKDITGQRFGRLTVLGYARTVGKASTWRCRCDCGAEIVARGDKLRGGRTGSCGCLNADLARARRLTHGESCHARNTREYVAWCRMIQRCEDPNDISFENYGGRGIAVCEEWRSDYEAFLAKMGRKPSPQHSLDRIDNEGHYQPDNCRWATKSEQMRNRRKWKRHIT